MKVSLGTKVRTVALFITLVNQVLSIFKINPIPFNSEEVEMLVSTLLTGAAAIWAWWKNNSFTKAAIKADENLKEDKAKN